MTIFSHYFHKKEKKKEFKLKTSEAYFMINSIFVWGIFYNYNYNYLALLLTWDEDAEDTDDELEVDKDKFDLEEEDEAALDKTFCASLSSASNLAIDWWLALIDIRFASIGSKIKRY